MKHSLLTPSEVAKLFKVDPKTVTRWSNNGKITCVKTAGGHRRYKLEEVQKLLNGSQSVAI
jgi:excisionase family DNA binding protein